MSTVERAATATANYFGGWITSENHSGTVSNVQQSYEKADQLADEISKSIEQSDVSPTSQEDIQNLVISTAQEVAARHKEDGASDDEIAAARLIVLAKLLSHQEGNAQMSTIRGRQNLAQCLAGLVGSKKNNTVDAIKVAELVINSDYTKSLGRIEATLGQALQTVDGSNQISDADKKAFTQAVYDSDVVHSAGPETAMFLKNYLKNLAHLQDHPDDLNAVSDAIFGSYLVNFGDAAQDLSGVGLENGIGLAMGLKPDQSASSGKAALFSGEQLKTIKTIANQIQKLGGKNAKISAMPVLLAPSDGKEGMQKFMLWRVTTAQNKDIYVDTLGQAHNSVNDFIEHNKLGFGRFVVARDGRMTVDQNGKVDVQEVEKSAYSEQDAIKDAAKIRAAMDKDDFIDWGTDEDAVYDVLTPRSTAEIDMIRKAYNKEYDHGHADFDKDLHDEFKDDKVELDRLNALLKGKYNTTSENEARAAEMKAELDDFAVDEQGVLKMFERIPAQERQTVAETYARMYGKSQQGAEAVDYLLSQCRDSFNDEEMARAKDLLKPENGDFEAGAARDAAGKLRVAVEGWGTDEDTIFKVLSGKDPHQIQAINDAYQKKYGETLESRLKDELNASEWTYAAKLLNPVGPNADEASKAKWEAERSAAHLYYAMEGVGTKKDIIKAELEGKTPQQVQAIIDAYHYKGQSLHDRLVDDLEGTEEQEILHLLDIAKIKDQADMEKWQTEYDAKRLHVAVAGLGDKDLIRQVLADKSKDQIHGDGKHEGIAEAYKRLYGTDLRSELDGELDGRDWMEIRQIYDGGAINLNDPNADPEKVIAEQIRRQRGLSEYERQGLSWKDTAMLANPVTGAFTAMGSDKVRGGLQKLMHWDSNYETDRERLDRNLGDAEKALKEYKETGDKKKLAEAAGLAGFTENDLKTLAQNKDALTNAVVTGATVVVGTLATLPVGGWGGVALAVGASTLTAGVGYTAMDSQIGAGEIARQTLIAGVAGGFGAPVRGASGAVTKVALTETAAVGKTVALRSVSSVSSARSVEEGAVKLAGGSAPRAAERGLLRTETEAGAPRIGQLPSTRTSLATGAKMGAINNGAVAFTDVATDPRILHDPKAAILGVVTGVVSGAAMGVTFVGSALGLGRLFKATRQVRTTAESRQAFDTPSVPPSTGPAPRTIKGEVVNASSQKPANPTVSLHVSDETGQSVEIKAQVLGSKNRSGSHGLEERPLPEPSDILQPGAKDIGQKWKLVNDDDAYFAVPRIMGASADHPVPVGSQSAKHLRSHAKVRGQREELAERLASPPPIKHGGKDWEFVRVDGNGAEASVYLRPAESRDQFVTRAELANGTAFWENMETGARREINLSEEADTVLLDRLTKPGESIRSSERLLFLHADDYMRQGVRLNGTDPEPRIGRIGVSSDANLLRMKLPDSHGIRIPLHELKSVPVRLKGKERDGVFFLSLNNQGKLVVSRAGENGKVEVRPEDVVGEYVNHSSYTFGKVPVKSTRAARWGELTGARPPQEASHTSPLDALSEYGIKPLPRGHIKTVEMGTGDQLIQNLTKFVEELEPKTPIVIRQWRFDDGGSEKNAPFMKELVKAICGHARSGAPVDLVLSRGKLSPLMEQTLADAGVRVHVASNLPHKMVVHQKSIATPDKSIIYTGPFDPKAGKRMEMMVELPPHLSRLYFQHEALAATRGSAVGLQQKYLADLAAHGVVIDRPDVSAAYAGRSYWALSRGAKKSIELYVKELAHPEFTKLLLEKARHGVSIKIRLAEPDNNPLDNASQRFLLQAIRENPDLDISVKSYEWNEFPYRHFNAIIADNEVGSFGTLYPWSNGLGQIDPAGSGTEHALILAGKDLASMRDAMKKAEETIKESGRGAYSTVDEVPAVSIFGFRGAGSAKDLLAPDAPHPYVITGHVGYSFNGGETIYGFGPKVGDEMSAPDAVKSLMKGASYPGAISDDTGVFRSVANNSAVDRSGDPQVVIEQRIAFLRAQFDRIRKEHDRIRADSPSEDVLYSFPGRNECAFNCATFPSKLGIPIPEKTGNMRTYMPSLADAGRAWKPKED